MYIHFGSVFYFAKLFLLRASYRVHDKCNFCGSYFLIYLKCRVLFIYIYFLYPFIVFGTVTVDYKVRQLTDEM